MNILTFLNRTIVAVGVIAIGALLSPQSARAQLVIGTSATGAEAQSGNGSTATGTDAIAGGKTATASNTFSTAIGDSSIASGVLSTAYGGDAMATGAQSTAIGFDALALNTDATAVGFVAVATGADSTAVGFVAVATGVNSTAVGSLSAATGANATALGSGALADFANSTAIGVGAKTTRANQMAFGTATNTYTMAGVTSAASTAAQSGPTELVTTDLSGNLAAVNLQPVISNLSKRIENTRNEEQAGIALAIATAQIRYDERPGKMSIGGGVGGFQHEAGGALGLGYTAPNERIRFNVSAGGSTHGDFGGGGGLSITLN